MKAVEHVKDLYKGKNSILYTIENGLTVHDVTIDAGIGEEI